MSNKRKSEVRTIDRLFETFQRAKQEFEALPKSYRSAIEYSVAKAVGKSVKSKAKSVNTIH